jgi:ubiquinone/menaquinone biosynthesis C-methylase UbiE
MKVPFPDHNFDIITVGYGLRNLSDWKAGLGEMQRVAKGGARLLVLEFGKPKQPLWRSVYFGYLRCFVPLLGLLFCGSASAYSYILESLKHYPAQEGVAAEMRRLGLENVRVLSFLGGVMTINYGEQP